MKGTDCSGLIASNNRGLVHAVDQVVVCDEKIARCVRVVSFACVPRGHTTSSAFPGSFFFFLVWLGSIDQRDTRWLWLSIHASRDGRNRGGNHGKATETMGFSVRAS